MEDCPFCQSKTEWHIRGGLRVCTECRAIQDRYGSSANSRICRSCLKDNVDLWHDKGRRCLECVQAEPGQEEQKAATTQVSAKGLEDFRQMAAEEAQKVREELMAEAGRQNEELRREMEELKAAVTPTFKETDFPPIAPKKTNTSTEISPSQTQQATEAHDDLTCGLCEKVVEDPRQCQNCDRMFCFPCLDAYLKNTKDCKLCAVPFRERSRIAQLCLRLLAGTVYNCDMCPESFKHADRHKHFDECPGRNTFACPFC